MSFNLIKELFSDDPEVNCFWKANVTKEDWRKLGLREINDEQRIEEILASDYDNLEEE